MFGKIEDRLHGCARFVEYLGFILAAIRFFTIVTSLWRGNAILAVVASLFTAIVIIFLFTILSWLIDGFSELISLNRKTYELAKSKEPEDDLPDNRVKEEVICPICNKRHKKRAACCPHCGHVYTE